MTHMTLWKTNLHELVHYLPPEDSSDLKKNVQTKNQEKKKKKSVILYSFCILPGFKLMLSDSVSIDSCSAPHQSMWILNQILVITSERLFIIPQM